MYRLYHNYTKLSRGMIKVFTRTTPGRTERSEEIQAQKDFKNSVEILRSHVSVHEETQEEIAEEEVLPKLYKGENVMKKSIESTGVDTITQCPVCGSTNITFNMGMEEVKEGCVSGCLFSYIWIIILLLIPIVGWIILIIKLRDKRIDSVTYAVCQNCGNSWVAQNKNAERRKNKIVVV